MSAALSVCGLHRAFPGTDAPALDSLDLRIGPGRCVAVLGPSGSGKTTALRLIAGLDAPDRGDVIIDGRSVLALPPERRGLAMVSQRPLLFPYLSVLDNVAFAARMNGAPRRTARRSAQRYLDLVQLTSSARRRPATLSGGQAQRVALARALAAEPAVLLLDEPFSALDPVLRADMHRLLAEVRAVLEPTILLVTHDQDEAATVADSIAVLMNGHLLQHDAPARLYARPASLAVSRFLGGLNEIPGHLVDGVHHSALGPLALAPGATILNGPAVLLVRQESVVLVSADEPRVDAVGRVARSAPRGARQLVQITTAAGIIHAEPAAGQAPAVGASVGLLLPVQARTAVATPAPVLRICAQGNGRTETSPEPRWAGSGPDRTSTSGSS